MPNLPGEGAGDDNMLHGLSVLVAKSTSVVVGETVASQSIGSPAAVKVGQPGEHLNAQGAQHFQVRRQYGADVEPAKRAL